LKRGTVAWIRPGQVLRFDLPEAVEGWLLLFTADVLAGDLAVEPIGPRIVLGRAAADVMWLLERVRRLARPGVRLDRTSLLHHLLQALLLTVHGKAMSARDAVAAPGGTVFALFRREVERRFAVTRRVEDYERAIGYSARTLTRASKAASGWSAKKYIDRHVLLESRRLLAYTDMTVGEIAQRVGFSELTNFIKFFRREGGESPSEFRRRGR
jgi:AraC-like DNA-binding protein